MSIDDRLDLDDVRPLLRAVERREPRAARASLHALVRLPLNHRAWLGVARAASARFDELGETTCEDLARIPVRSVRERVRSLTESDRLRDRASIALARVGDGAAFKRLTGCDPNDWPSEIFELLPRMEGEGSIDLLQSAFERLTDLEQRFWLAVAMGRQGRQRPLQRVLKQIAAHPHEFAPFYGDPMYFEQRLRSARASFPELSQWLEKFARGARSEPVQNLARHLAEPVPSIVRAAPPSPKGKRSDPTAVERARREAERIVKSKPFAHQGLRATEPDAGLLCELDDEEKSQLFMTLFQQLSEEVGRAPGLFAGGNEIMDLARESGGLLLPNRPELVDTFGTLEASGGGAKDQFAWLLARRDLKETVDGLAPVLEEEGERPELAARMLAQVATARGTESPPYFGGGAGLADDGPIGGALIDEAEPAGAEPAEAEQGLQDVHVGTVAPAQARPGDELTVRFIAYIEELEDEVAEELGRKAEGDRVRLGLARARWRAGTPVTVGLAARGLEIDDPVQHFEWDGVKQELLFDCFVPEDRPLGTVKLKLNVKVGEHTVLRLRQRLEIVKELTSGEVRSAEGVAARTAFASYSSQDRLRVLDRAAEIRDSAGIDIFLDVIDLRQSKEWRPQLREAILSRDQFYLFWSRHASASKEVEWEYTTALSAKGEDHFELRQLDMIEEAPLPDLLKHLHGRDLLMDVRKAHAGKGGG
jgi:hypothetical protein